MKQYCADDFVITNCKGRQGLSLCDGTIVIEPLFDSIIYSRSYRNYLAYSQLSDVYTEIFPRTYGDGLICCERFDMEQYRKHKHFVYGWPNIQFFMDSSGKHIVTFNEEWFNKNDIPTLCCPIHPSEVVCFQNGYLEIEIRDGDAGYVYKIDKDGNAKFMRGVSYCTDDYSIQDYYNDNPDMFEGVIF